MNRSRRAERADVRLEDPEVASRQARLDLAPAPCGRSAARRRPPARRRDRRGSVSPVTSCQRMRKCSATSATAGPSIRARASCQPTRAAGAVVGAVVPVAGLARSGRCRRRTRPGRRSRSSSRGGSAAAAPCASSAHWISRAAATAPRASSRTSPREGRKSGSGAPAQTSTRTSTRSASSASRLRRTTARSSRRQGELGGEEPAGRYGRATSRAASSAAIRGSASAPSIRTSSELPGAAAVRPPPSRPAGGSRAREPADPAEPALVVRADLRGDGLPPIRHSAVTKPCPAVSRRRST